MILHLPVRGATSTWRFDFRTSTCPIYLLMLQKTLVAMTYMFILRLFLEALRGSSSLTRCLEASTRARSPYPGQVCLL